MSKNLSKFHNLILPPARGQNLLKNEIHCTINLNNSFYVYSMFLEFALCFLCNLESWFCFLCNRISRRGTNLIPFFFCTSSNQEVNIKPQNFNEKGKLYGGFLIDLVEMKGPVTPSGTTHSLHSSSPILFFLNT